VTVNDCAVPAWRLRLDGGLRASKGRGSGEADERVKDECGQHHERQPYKGV
jgi:hypothetical protein